MSHVSGRFLEDCLNALQKRDIDTGALLEGLGIDDADLRKEHPTIEWNVYVSILERLEECVGGPKGLETLGEIIAELGPAPVLRRLAGFAASPEVLYTAGERWALRRALPILESRVDVINERRIVIICRIPGSFRECPQLFHLATGALRCCTRILGLEDADVMSHVQPRWGEWIVIPPPSRSLWTRCKQIARALFSARAAIEQLDNQQRELDEGFRKLRTAYAELEESEARFRALTESAVDLIVELAPDGRLRYVSPSAKELLDRDHEKVIGEDWSKWVHPEDRDALSDFLEVAFNFDDERHAGPTLRIQHAEGTWIWMEMAARIYKTHTGENCVVARLRDVSQRVVLEERERRYRDNLEARVAQRTEELEKKHREYRELQSLLLDAERIGAAQDLAGRVAHSINNPLGALIGQLALMIEDSSAPNPQLEDLLELSNRVSRVVRHTLELYREGKINRAPEEIETILEELQQSLAHRSRQAGVEMRVKAAKNLPVMPVDRTLLLSALESTAENAFDWMEEGGELVIRAIFDAKNDKLKIHIEDSGPGVPPENRDEIFDAFFTTKPNGTGLGLAIARGIVRGHEGEITIKKRRGGGAHFTIELPRQPSP